MKSIIYNITLNNEDPEPLDAGLGDDLP